MAEPNGYIQGKDGKPLELVDATARRQLAGKLDAPGNVKAGDYLRVKSVGEDGTVVLEGADAPGGGSGQNPDGTIPDGRVIDLKKYGITAVDYEPPFTEEMYHVAYANGTGIQKAIDDAKAAGMTAVVLPAGRYPVCYHATADDGYNPIINIKGVNLFAAGVTLYVIYDEEGNNPYFTGATPRLLQGTVIETDSDVYGIHCIGERAYRVELAQYREFSSGIALNGGSNGNTIDSCICEYFSGDGFGAGKHMEQLGGWPGDVWTATAWNGTEFAFHEYCYTSGEHGADWIDQTRPILMRAQNYNLWTYAPIKIHCFDAEQNYIGKVQFWQGEYFYFLPGTAKWRMEIRHSAPHAEDSTVSYDIYLGYGFFNGSVLRNCIARFNTRGGMSNLPNNAHLIDCIMHHNGCAWNGLPGFYDGTQFGLDIEDIYINDITLERCNIYGNLHGVIWRCRNIKFLDCTIEGHIKSLNYCGGFHAEHTKFLGGVALYSPAKYGQKIAIGCEFAGTIPKEIVIMDDIAKVPTSAVLTGEKMTVLELRNTAGETVMSIDLSFLGKGLGEEIVNDALLFDMDALQFSADALTIDDKTGNASMTAKGYAIKGDGLTSQGGNADSVAVTWHNAPGLGQNVAIELFVTGGFPYFPWRGAEGTYEGFLINERSAGHRLPETETGLFEVAINTTHNYIKRSGEAALTSAYSGYGKFYADDGSLLGMSETNFPGSGIMEYGHVLINLHSDGTSEMYLNGYLLDGEFAPAPDFAQWDFGNYESSFRLWSGNNDNDVYLLRAARLYNKCLNKDEVRNNLAYEVARLKG